MLKQKKDFFCIPVAIILTLLLYFNISLVTSDDGQETFDTYSEGIIISNLLFDNSYANETSFLRMMNPDMIFSDGHTGMYSDIVNDYISNTPPLKDEFGIYHSNLVFHRYIYSAIDAIFGHTKLSLKLMHFFNAFLFGLVLMYMIIWIKKITDSITGYILLVIISLFTPYLSMYATNLYWSAWSLFLPIVGSIFVLNIKEHRTKRSMFFISFIAAFITCTIKEVFYFEFVSTVMIAMMIPYIFYTVDKKWELKSTIKLCIFPIIGAILSFVVVSLIKLILLAKDFGSFKEATNMYLGPIVTRLLGDPTNNNPLISNSATESLLKVIQNMLAIPAFSVRFIGSLSHLKLIFVFIFLVVLVKLLESKSSIIFNRSIRNLAIIVCLSFFAPLSWFVLAKPHVAVHTIICSIVLYLPFTLLLIAFIVFTGRKVLEHLNSGFRRDGIGRFVKGYYVIIIISLLGFLFCLVTPKIVTNNYLFSEFKQQIENNGVLLVEERGTTIYYYEDALYYLRNKHNRNRYALHITPENTESINSIGDYSNVNFINMDFDFKDKIFRADGLFLENSILPRLNYQNMI